METVSLPLGRDAQRQGSDGQVGLSRKGFCGIPYTAAVLRHSACAPERTTIRLQEITIRVDGKSAEEENHRSFPRLFA